jgi:hypothetical protein
LRTQLCCSISICNGWTPIRVRKRRDCICKMWNTFRWKSDRILLWEEPWRNQKAHVTRPAFLSSWSILSSSERHEDIRWRWVLSFTPRPFYIKAKSSRHTLHRKLGEPHSPPGRTEVKISWQCRELNPDCPVHNPSLYLLKWKKIWGQNCGIFSLNKKKNRSSYRETEAAPRKSGWNPHSYVNYNLQNTREKYVLRERRAHMRGSQRLMLNPRSDPFSWLSDDAIGMGTMYRVGLWWWRRIRREIRGSRNWGAAGHVRLGFLLGLTLCWTVPDGADNALWDFTHISSPV